MEIALIVLSIFSLSFMIAYLSILRKLKMVSDGFSKLLIAYNMGYNAEEMSPPSLEDQDIHKESFIKFLSDSRDWAFDYIEEVQKGLQKFVSDLEPTINSFNKEEHKLKDNPFYQDLQIISNSFQELKKLLPEETDDRR